MRKSSLWFCCVLAASIAAGAAPSIRQCTPMDKGIGGCCILSNGVLSCSNLVELAPLALLRGMAGGSGMGGESAAISLNISTASASEPLYVTIGPNSQVIVPLTYLSPKVRAIGTVSRNELILKNAAPLSVVFFKGRIETEVRNGVFQEDEIAKVVASAGHDISYDVQSQCKKVQGPRGECPLLLCAKRGSADGEAIVALVFERDLSVMFLEVISLSGTTQSQYYAVELSFLGDFGNRSGYFRFRVAGLFEIYVDPSKSGVSVMSKFVNWDQTNGGIGKIEGTQYNVFVASIV